MRELLKGEFQIDNGVCVRNVIRFIVVDNNQIKY